MKKIITLGICILLLFLVGCVEMPEEAPKKSIVEVVSKTKVYSTFKETNPNEEINLILFSKEDFEELLQGENISEIFGFSCGHKISPKSYYAYLEHPSLLLIDSETLETECDFVNEESDEISESLTEEAESIEEPEISEEVIIEEPVVEPKEESDIVKALEETKKVLEDYQDKTSKLDKCTRLCAGDSYDIPYYKDQWYLTCSQLYYYAGMEALDEQIAECEK